MRYSFLILLLLIVFQGHVSGKQHVKSDTVSLVKITTPDNAINDFKHDYKFKYNRAAATPGLFERIALFISEWIGYRFLAQAAPWAINGILILAFVVLIVVLFRSRFQGVFLRNQNEKSLNISHNEIADNINFEELLNDALKQKNYNLAARYLYLIVLRQLNQKQLIIYKLGKTNFEYINEISDKDLLPYFRNVTHDYEYAWYGQFPLNESSYKLIESKYKNLTEKLHD